MGVNELDCEGLISWFYAGEHAGNMIVHKMVLRWSIKAGL